MNFYQFLIPRLEGSEFESSFEHYINLVRKGIGGFIVFGGELESLRSGIKRLQLEAELPLIIASDLEQGLGQQVKGGTVFPPAMALSEAWDKAPEAVRSAFGVMAEEAAYAGINTILAPVLDINSNPDNPIICTRAFCEDQAKVASLGVEMVQSLQSRGIMACGKHFPGHGATDIDSHISLPEISKPLEALEAFELVPFERAIQANVEMIMPGHLSVPALDPSGAPMTLSEKGLRYLRENMGFAGIIISDAMNMGGIGGHQPGLSVQALSAGVDLLLHPENPEQIVAALEKSSPKISEKRLRAFRTRLLSAPSDIKPSFDNTLSNALTEIALKLEGNPRQITSPFVITISDTDQPQGEAFISALGASGYQHFTASTMNAPLKSPPDADVIVAVFSDTRAWKGDTAQWLKEKVRELSHISMMFVAFGNPYTLRKVRLDDIREGASKAYAYWSSEAAQKAMAAKLKDIVH